jgi:hypothetical protein
MSREGAKGVQRKGKKCGESVGIDHVTGTVQLVHRHAGLRGKR